MQYKVGDILRSDAEALVNTVNCVGVMGRGIALQFKKAFPRNYRVYKQACDAGQVVPGKMLIVESGELSPRWIVNFPTKRHWKGKSRIEDVEVGLKALRSEIRERGITSIAIPPLGAGLGGLDWRDVKALIERELADLPDVRIVVFEPNGAPAPKSMVRTKAAPDMTIGRAALVTLMRRYLQGLLDPEVTLLEVHKLMYFMQEAGQPLRLNYTKGHYGPFATNLSHVLHAIEGHFVAGYADGGDAPSKRLEIVYGAEAEAGRTLSQDTEVMKRIERVGKLVEGFETPFGLELLATVHWLVREEGAIDTDQQLAALQNWNEGKQKFKRHHVDVAIYRLKTECWIQ